jgi:hypothetical protein
MGSPLTVFKVQSPAQIVDCEVRGNEVRWSSSIQGYKDLIKVTKLGLLPENSVAVSQNKTQLLRDTRYQAFSNLSS